MLQPGALTPNIETVPDRVVGESAALLEGARCLCHRRRRGNGVVRSEIHSNEKARTKLKEGEGRRTGCRGDPR